VELPETEGVAPVELPEIEGVAPELGVAPEQSVALLLVDEHAA